MAAFFGASEVVAIATGPTSAPAIAFGQLAIAHTPEWLKNFAISHFGEDDKLLLTVSIYAAFVLLAAAVGAIAVQLALVPVAVAAVGLLGAATAGAAATQAGGTGFPALPSAVGAVAGATAFAVLG